MWIRDVQASGCSERRGCKALPVGAFVEGELHLSWMQFFSKPIHAFYSLLFILYFFFFKRLIRGHYPGVIELPTSTFTEMRRLARDETPFLLAMQPRVTTLAW
jgi:hypothetical protein